MKTILFLLSKETEQRSFKQLKKKIQRYPPFDEFFEKNDDVPLSSIVNFFQTSKHTWLC